jgi:hypothetical protein
MDYPLGPVGACQLIDCVVVEPLSSLTGVSGNAAQFGHAAALSPAYPRELEASCATLRLSPSRSGSRKRTLTYTPTASTLPPRTGVPTESTPPTRSRPHTATSPPPSDTAVVVESATPRGSASVPATPVPTASPPPTASPEATLNLPLILEIALPSLLALIVLPILLYKCIRKIQDALSDNEFGGLGSGWASESEESPTIDRDIAMQLGQEDAGPLEYRRNTFFADSERARGRAARIARRAESSESSDW